MALILHCSRNQGDMACLNSAVPKRWRALRFADVVSAQAYLIFPADTPMIEAVKRETAEE